MGRLHLCFVIVATITAIHAQGPMLEIQPNERPVSREVGVTVALTCIPLVEDTSLVTSLEWRDPKDRRIEYNMANSLYVRNLVDQIGIILVFSSLMENQSGNYTCHASYASEQLVASAEVRTFVDINFVDAPENQYPVIGKDFTVKCKVKGNPPPSVDWNKDDRLIQSNEKFIISDGALIIKNVTELDDGVYKCTAFVPKTGKLKSRNIKIEVQIPPKISPMDTVTIIDGETASIKCTATGKPPPEYQWIKIKERQDLAVTDRFEVKKNTGELIMNRIEFNDDGIYKCRAKNTVDEDEATVKVNVLVKPRIYELLNVTAPIKTETKIICKAYGRPPPTVTFRKLSSTEPFRNGPQLDDIRVILEQQYFEEKGETFGTLIISNLTRSDDGLYECIADNIAGKGFKNGHITVEFPPTFERTKDLPPAWSWESKPGNLSCIPEAIPNATIIWRLGNIELRNNNNNNFKIEGNGPVSHLIVQPYNDRSLYTQYECIATNKYGTASTKIELRRAEVPRPIAQVKAESITATTVKWSIIPASHFDGLPIRSITVFYKPSAELSWEFARNHTWSYGAAYILENLIPQETYDYRFAATNDVGMGGYQNAQSISMPKRSEPAEPRILVESRNSIDENTSDRENVVTVSPYADHFEIRWRVPNDNGDPILYYLIRYCVTEKINGNWEDRECSEQIQQSVNHLSYQLDNLQPDTVYKIELRAHNAIGDSTPDQIRVRTARGIDPVVPVQSPAMSSAAIIGIVIAAILLVLLVLDITCFCINRIGLIALCCNSKSKQSDEEDPKLGREEQEPLRVDEKQMSVEFDGQHVYSKTGEIIGKHSAV